MKKSETNGAAPALGLQDVIYVLFKHKWKILISGGIGLLAALVVYLFRTPYYESQANLLINYVLQRGVVDDHETQLATGGRSGDQVITTEMEILRSGDLAADVAKAVGVERIVGYNGPTAVSDAASFIQLGMQVNPASKGSSVVYLSYRSGDSQLTQDVLREVVKSYFQKHLEIHRSVGAFETVAAQAEEVGNRLRQTEGELNRLKTQAGIISLQEELVSLATQRDLTRQGLLISEAELASQTSRVEDMEKQLGVQSSERAETDREREAALVGTRSAAADIELYTELSEKLKLLQKQDFELSAKFREDNPRISRIRRDIREVRTLKQQLVQKNPGLVSRVALSAGSEAVDPLDLFEQERAKLREISAKFKVYKEHLAAQEARFTQLSEASLKISDLERRKEMEDGEYRLLESKLKKARVDRTLDPSRMPNIRVVQEPSTPVKTFSATVKKVIFGLAGAGFAVGIGLALLIELVIDRRVKRPKEIEARFHLPLMLSIPYVSPNDRGVALISADPESGEGEKPNRKTSALAAVRGRGSMRSGPRPRGHFIETYSEAIRDRIVFNFQVNNMTHKPKMMAVTGLSAGAGTSTIASGLAKAFSEINGAKVLLVDLSSEYPDDNPMFGKKPLHSLVSALQAARNARFKEGSQNLYLASAAARKPEAGATAFGPMHLYEILPHFRASDFDYVIFDMPPMGPTSPTLSMAGLMDKVLLVIDGEDTDRETLKWGYSELVKGRADVACVFNKARNHVPRWLGGDA